MATIQLVLLLACAVLVSSLAEPLLPKVSLPLVQIALGALIAFFSVTPIDITLNPDYFLIVFIAPLLFYESKRADKLALWKNRTGILSLAIGLVVAIALAVGFAVHAMIPSIPLAAAFALGGALGPTDAVAVAALSGSAKLGTTEKARLNGEALLNDASGVVTFQFAVAAAVTGSFSALQATTTFTVEFFGGILLGLVVGLVVHILNMFTDSHDISSNVFRVLLDVTLPFITYLLSEVVGVSGILAVVSAGLFVSAVNERRVSPDQSGFNIVSDNVWKVISFTLNGVVFVLLGMMLPKSLIGTWWDVPISNSSLIVFICMITVILIVVRYLWLVMVDTVFKDPITKTKPVKNATFWKNTLIATIGGPKGAVTLSIVMSTPFYTLAGTAYPQRDLIIFLASGVILLTLVLANFLLPALAPAPSEKISDYEKEVEARVDILRNVIDRMNSERTRENAQATYAVVRSYNKRVEDILNRSDILETESSSQLRIEVVKHLQLYVTRLIDTKQVDPVAGYDYLRKLSLSIRYLQHRGEGAWWFFYALRHTFTTLRVFRRYAQRFFRRVFTGVGTNTEVELAIEAEQEAIRYLTRYVESPNSPYPAEIVSKVLLDYRQTLRALMERRPSITAFTRTTHVMEDVQRKAYRYELEEIRSAQDRGEIKRSTASRMRDNVYLMLVDLNTEIA